MEMAPVRMSGQVIVLALAVVVALTERAALLASTAMSNALVLAGYVDCSAAASGLPWLAGALC